MHLFTSLKNLFANKQTQADEALLREYIVQFYRNKKLPSEMTTEAFIEFEVLRLKQFGMNKANRAYLQAYLSQSNRK